MLIHIGVFSVVYILIRVMIVPVVLAVFKVKHMRDDMNEEKWDIYFSSLSLKEYLKRIIIILFIPIALCSAVGYLLYQRKYTKEEAFWLTCLLFLVNAVCITYKLVNHREELVSLIFKMQKSERDDNNKQGKEYGEKDN